MFLFLGNNSGCIIALPRARDQDSKMLVQVRRVVAWLLARLVRGAFRWILGEWNTADDPSRLAGSFAVAGGDATAALPLFFYAARGYRSPPL